MFSDGRSKRVVDRRGMRHNTDNSALEQRWYSMRQWYVDTFTLAGLFDMRFTCHVDEVDYVRRLQALPW